MDNFEEYIECIGNTNTFGVVVYNLTIGKLYKILRLEDQRVEIIDDDQTRRLYYLYRFRRVCNLEAVIIRIREEVENGC